MMMDENLFRLFQDEVYTELLYDRMDRTLGVKRTISGSKKDHRSISKAPKLMPAEPNIFCEEPQNRPYFGIKDLYRDLFTERKTSKKRSADGSLDAIKKPRQPLAALMDEDGTQPDDEGIVVWLLPPEIFQNLRSEDELSKSDYKEFLLESTKNNKLMKRLYQIFARDRLRFVQRIQARFAENLKAVRFSNIYLLPYLRVVGDYLIVPDTISQRANRQFHALLERHSHSDISLVIANFFLSAMLGLYAVHYAKGSGPNYKEQYYKKTYLLNGFGMEYIWLPEMSNNQRYLTLREARSAYRSKDLSRLFRLVSDLLLSEDIDRYPEIFSEASALAGFALHHYPQACPLHLLRFLELPAETSLGFDSEREKKEAEDKCLQQCVRHGNPPAAYQQEAHYYLYQNAMAAEEEELAFPHLEEAFSAGYAKAVHEATRRLLRGQILSDGITGERCREQLTRIIENERLYSGTDVSECCYLRALLSKQDGDIREAEADFARAAQKGHERARQETSRKKRMERQRLPSFSDEAHLPCCFANSLTGNNLALVSSMPDGAWSFYTADVRPSGWPEEAHINRVRDVEEFLSLHRLRASGPQRPRYVFLFMSEAEEKNLNECLILLDRLFNLALDLPEERLVSLIDHIDIYVSARYETASMLIDANLSDMGKDIFFRVHIMDETRDAVHRLLCDAPLFLPCIDPIRPDQAANVVLFGCTETNYRFIKESVACAWLGEAHPVTVTMFGLEAERMGKRFRQECPGVYHESRIACIRPSFLPCSIEETDFPDLIYGMEHDKNPDDPIVRALSRGNYFVVDLAQDYESIRFAMELRTWLLRSRGAFDRAPFIAVKCTGANNSYLAKHLALSGQDGGDTYYSKYDLFPFGIAEELYACSCVLEQPKLEQTALRIHKSYYGNKERQAENDYYSYSYNADSSLLTAIGLSYRLFSGGAYFSQRDAYVNYGVFDSPELLEAYVDAIKTKEEVAAAREQSRWNGFMLSRGWEPASVNQVQAYKDQSTGTSHKHTLAKLHPFIREWEELETEDLMRILGMLKTRFDYDKRPKATTRKSIVDTQKFLRGSDQENRKQLLPSNR